MAKIVSIMLLIALNIRSNADSTSEAQNASLRAFTKIYGKSIKNRAEVLIRRSGVSEAYAVNTLICVKAIVEKKVKGQTSIYEYKLGGEYNWSEEEVKFFIKTSF